MPDMCHVLRDIVRTSQQRQPIGHDLMVRARSIVRRALPLEYAAIMKRWPDPHPSPLPPVADKQKRSPGMSPAEAFAKGQKILKEGK